MQFHSNIFASMRHLLRFGQRYITKKLSSQSTQNLLQVWGRGSEPGAEHEAVQDLGEGRPQRERGVPAPGGELRQQGQWSKDILIPGGDPSSVFRQRLIGTFPWLHCRVVEPRDCVVSNRAFRLIWRQVLSKIISKLRSHFKVTLWLTCTFMLNLIRVKFPLH